MFDECLRMFEPGFQNMRETTSVVNTNRLMHTKQPPNNVSNSTCSECFRCSKLFYWKDFIIVNALFKDNFQ